MKTIIIGNTEYSVMLLQYLEEAGIEVDAFCVDKEYLHSENLCGKEVISTEQIVSAFPPEICELYLGVGYSKIGRVKKNIFELLKSKGYIFKNYIHPSSVINVNTLIGEGNVIFENVVVQYNVKIGNGNLFFSNATIMHDGIIGDYNTFGAGSVMNGFVSVDECNFFGSNSTIKDHVKICNDCLIGAGAYVKKDCEIGTAVLPAHSSILENGAYSFRDKL